MMRVNICHKLGIVQGCAVVEIEEDFLLEVIDVGIIHQDFFWEGDNVLNPMHENHNCKMKDKTYQGLVHYMPNSFHHGFHLW